MTFIKMSVGDDTEEWASRIINELFNEKNSPNMSNEDTMGTDIKVSRNKYRDSEVSYTENNLSNVCNLSRDCIADSPLIFDIESETFVKTPESSLNTRIAVSKSVKKIDSIPPDTGEKNICLNLKNISSDDNLKPNVELLRSITTSEIMFDSIETHTSKESTNATEYGSDDKHVENIDILSFNSKLGNSSEKLLLKNVTVSSVESNNIFEGSSFRNGREYVKNKKRVSHETILLETMARSSLEDRKRIREKCELSESQDLKKPRNESDEIEVTNYVIQELGAVVTNSSDDLIIVNDDTVYSEPCENTISVTKPSLKKKEYDTKKDKLSSFMTIHLEESNSITSVKDPQRIDEEHEYLGFPDTRKRYSGDTDANDQYNTCMSSYLEDFFHCIRNEVEFCPHECKDCEGTHSKVKCESYKGHTEKAQNCYSNKNLINADLIKRETRKKWSSEDNMGAEYFVDTEKQSIQKEKQISETRKYNSETKTMIENYKVCPFPDEFKKEINELSTMGMPTEENNITPKCIPCHMQMICCSEDEGEISYGYNYDDDIDREIIAQRIYKVVTLYRNICSFVEVFFVKPFANIFVEWFEFIGFVIFLSICMLYKSLQNITTQISSFSKNLEIYTNSMFERKNTIILTKLKYPTSSLTDSEFKLGARNESDKAELASSFSLNRNDIVKKSEGTNCFICVEPKDVLIVDNSFELVKQNLGDLYYKGENYLELFSREQYKAAVKTYENCSANIMLLEYKENNSDVITVDESNFDMEIIASSKNSHCKKYSSIASCSANEFSRNLKTIPREYSSDAQIKSLSMKESNNSLFKVFSITSGGNMGPILNSTEIDNFAVGVMDKSISSSGYEILSASDVDAPLNTSKLCTSPITTPQRNKHNSSLSINLPSFCSRSDAINSTLSLDKPNNKGSDQCKKSSEISKMLLDLDVEVGYRARSLINLSISAYDGSESMSVKAERESLQTHEEKELQKKASRENHKTEDSESSVTKYERREQNLDVTQASLIGLMHEETSDIMVQDSRDSTEFPFENSNLNASSSNKFDSLVEIESASKDVRRDHKRKSSISLRRRMSLILFGWKNIQVMPCMMSNTKSKKKYKKYSGAEEM